LPLGLCHLVWYRMERARLLPRRPAYLVLTGGALLGALAAYGEPLALDWMELSFQVSKVGAGPALSAMLLMAAPLEEALKALVVWPLYVRRQLLTARLGLAFAMCAGAGFAAGEAAVLALSTPFDVLMVVRILTLG